jgi:hypothetical protein
MGIDGRVDWFLPGRLPQTPALNPAHLMHHYPQSRSSKTGSGLVLRLTLGICLGIAIGNIAIGLAFGIILGTLFGASSYLSCKKDQPQPPPTNT